jgi:predicted nucleic acid-binding protein
MSTDRRWYLDTSVLMRVLSKESPAAMAWLNGARREEGVLCSSRLLTVETWRTVVNRRLSGITAPPDATVQAWLDRIALTAMTSRILTMPRSFECQVRAGDAIHLATAKVLDNGSLTVVTHDVRLAEAAVFLGLPVHDPVTDDPRRGPVT